MQIRVSAMQSHTHRKREIYIYSRNGYKTSQAYRGVEEAETAGLLSLSERRCLSISTSLCL
jgi:hypothetical protein